MRESVEAISNKKQTLRQTIIDHWRNKPKNQRRTFVLWLELFSRPTVIQKRGNFRVFQNFSTIYISNWAENRLKWKFIFLSPKTLVKFDKLHWFEKPEKLATRLHLWHFFVCYALPLQTAIFGNTLKLSEVINYIKSVVDGLSQDDKSCAKKAALCEEGSLVTKSKEQQMKNRWYENCPCNTHSETNNHHHLFI